MYDEGLMISVSNENVQTHPPMFSKSLDGKLCIKFAWPNNPKCVLLDMILHDCMRMSGSCSPYVLAEEITDNGKSLASNLCSSGSYSSALSNRQKVAMLTVCQLLLQKQWHHGVINHGIYIHGMPKQSYSTHFIMHILDRRLAETSCPSAIHIDMLCRSPQVT